ncbi:MAG: hypothetical protein NVSMB5_17070 [Candidatus Velthaea sp.]
MLAISLQLGPPLPLETSKGSGFAHFLLDYGAEFNLMFVVSRDQEHHVRPIPANAADGVAQSPAECRLTRT